MDVNPRSSYYFHDVLQISVEKIKNLPLPQPNKLLLTLVCDLFIHLAFPSKQLDHSEDIHRYDNVSIGDMKMGTTYFLLQLELEHRSFLALQFGWLALCLLNNLGRGTIKGSQRGQRMHCITTGSNRGRIKRRMLHTSNQVRHTKTQCIA